VRSLETAELDNCRRKRSKQGKTKRSGLLAQRVPAGGDSLRLFFSDEKMVAADRAEGRGRAKLILRDFSI
jgi:hypothetical protein